MPLKVLDGDLKMAKDKKEKKILLKGYKIAYTKEELKDRQSKGYTMPLDLF